jgi:DNA (cytosine-5)-methyltransferase 1
MKYLSVCSGIEAATAAWHPLGWEPFAFSEIDKFPAAVLDHHYPGVPNLGDMTRFKEWPDAAINVLVGGTPCQSFSVAGLRKGLDDPRGNLMLTYLAIAQRYQPQWLVWENVPGVLSSNGGRDFGTFLGALGKLGYGFAYRVLDAQYYGVAQRRRRVFVIGYLGDWRPPAAVLFEPESLRGDSPPSRGKREAVAALTANGVGTCGADDNQGQAGHLTPDIATTVRARDAKGSPDSDCTQALIAGTLLNNGKAAGSATIQDAESGLLVAHTLRGEGFDASEDGTGRGTPLVAVAHAPAICTITCDGEIDAPVPPLMARSSRGGAQTLSPGHQTDGHMLLQNQAHAVRRLTPRECERLQGFPDDFTLIPAYAKGSSKADREEVARWIMRGDPTMTLEEGLKWAGHPDGPRYKALGNSMAVPVMRWLGERIDLADQILVGR